MTGVTYNWCGDNYLKDFAEGTRVIFPGGGAEYVDSIQQGEKNLIMVTLSRDNIWGKPCIMRRSCAVILDESQMKIEELQGHCCSFSEQGASRNHEKLERRLNELERGKIQ